MTGRVDSVQALAVVGWLAAHHGHPWTEAAALARVPQVTPTPEGLSAALATAGLTTRLVHRKIGRIDPATLPVVLFDRDGGLLILSQLEGGRARIVTPGGDRPEEELTPAALARRVTGEVLLVTPVATTDNPAQEGHWFWQPMRENAGAWAQVALAALCINVLGLALPIFVMNVYDRVIPNLAFVTLWTLAAGLLIAFAMDWGLRMVRAGVLDRIGRRLDIGISATLFRHALSLRPTLMPGGALGTATFLRDFEAVREFFGAQSLTAAIDLCFVGVFLFVLWLIVGPLAFVPAVAIVVTLVLAALAQWPMRHAVGQVQAAAARRQTVLIEALSGLETIKTLNAEPAMLREWDRSTVATARLTGKSRFWSAFATNGTQTIMQLNSLAVITLGVFLIAEGRITVGALIAANILSGRVLAPLGAMSQTVFRAQAARRSMAALSRLMAQPSERGDKVRSSLRLREGRVELRGVTYRYPGAEVPALDRLDLTLEPGDCVALLGRVGSGKSTLGKLVAGLIAPEEGQILIDGAAQAQFDPAELRAGIGYLPQDPELFTGTLGENLTIGAPGAAPDDIARALRIAGIDRFVAGLPQGLGTFAGERGRHLSGGQRQGIALARLILRRPKVLFLDEPTNAMDRDMETAVASRLSELRANGVTLILCTHRPSLAQTADRMVVLDGGRKALDGPKQAVLAAMQKAALGAPKPGQA
jgi:ATP-binding cassette subfamily C protein LapB